MVKGIGLRLNGGRLFGIHVWKSIRWVENWVKVEENVRILVERPETPEEYRFRKLDMFTIRFLRKVVTFRILGGKMDK